METKLSGLTREQFIAEHIKTCTAMQCRKYDKKKGREALHSPEYSRRRCAKVIWRAMLKRKGL